MADPESDPQPGRGLELSESEEAVLRELGRREIDAPSPKLASTYRRLIELSRSDDPVDAILVGHLVRELLAALPGALGIELVHETLQYANELKVLADLWPPDARSGQPPDAIATELRRLLEEHDRATGRAREGPRALTRREDRARAGYVPEPSIDQWIELSTRGTGLSHRLRNMEQGLPRPEQARALAEELTATLIAAVGPYFRGISEIDTLLAVDNPTATDARRLAGLLRTPSQFAYFFDRADARWLNALAGRRRFLTHPPGLVEVGGGYVRVPDWPQGRFLARVAPSEPALVTELAGRVPATNNPRVAKLLVDIARALPAESAARLVPNIARRMAQPLAVEHAAVDSVRLIRDLAGAGLADAAADLTIAVADAAIASPRESTWHLEQVLGDSVDAVVATGGELGPRLRAMLRRLIRRMGPVRRHPTVWLRNVDRRPQYGADEAWFVASALYRVLLRSPADVGKALAASLLDDREPTFARIALAAIAERPDLIEDADGVLGDPRRWDGAGTTRYEFRRALDALWRQASVAGQQRLLEFAEAAEEAAEIIERLAAEGIEHDPDDLRREWRSRLLHRVRDAIPGDWRERIGSLESIEDDRLPEPSVEWAAFPSPFSEEELADLQPRELLERLREWQPSTEQHIGDVTEGLARTAAAVIVARLPQFSSLGQELAQLRPPLLAGITSATDRGVREGAADDRSSGVQLMLAIGEALQPAEDEISLRQAKRDIARVIGFAASEDLLGEPDAQRALPVLQVLLADPDSSGASEEQDASNGYDVGMLALNSVRGKAAEAIVDLFLACRRAGRDELASAASTALRRAMRTDMSRSVRAAIGLRLPWLLAHDVENQAEWVELLFGDAAPPDAARATWGAYLRYTRFFPDVARALAPQYAAAVARLGAEDTEDQDPGEDVGEQLGIHVAAAHLLAFGQEAEDQWLATFYARAADPVRGRVTRWIAEQAANAETDEPARARARAFLEARVAAADAEADVEELKAVSWIASITDHEDEALERVLLPALEKTGGETENEAGAVNLAARQAPVNGPAAARMVQLLVEGDPWNSLPYVAADDLRLALEQLMRSDADDVRTVAEDIVNTLGAQGFLEFRDLLGARRRGDGQMPENASGDESERADNSLASRARILRRRRGATRIE